MRSFLHTNATKAPTQRRGLAADSPKPGRGRFVPGLVQILLFAFSLWSPLVLSETFNFPEGNLPTGCSASNSTVTCSQDIRVFSDDEVVINEATEWILEGDADLQIDDSAKVNDSGSADDLAINVGGQVDQREDAIIRGDIEAGDDVLVSGKVEGRIRSGRNVKIDNSTFDPDVEGDIIAEQDIDLESDSRVVGNLLAGRDVDVKSDAELNGCGADEDGVVVDGDVSGTIDCSENDFGECSLRIGEATINEANREGGGNDAFIEVKILDESIPEGTYEEWTVAFETEESGNNSTSQSDIRLGDLDDSGFPWLVLKEPDLEDPKEIDLKNGLEVRLDDASGNAIDYLSHRDFSGQFSVSCPFKHDTTSAPEENNPFTILRLPDGTGGWTTGGPGNSGGEPTEGDSNEDTDDGGGGVDSYAVFNPGTGITCAPVSVAIEARNAGGNAVTVPDGTDVLLSTDTGRGAWSRVRAGSGTLDDPVLGDGEATYTFPGGESAVELSFDYPDIESDPEEVVISVDDGDANGTGDPLAVSLAGFRFLDDDADTDDDIISNQIAGKPSDTAPGSSLIQVQAIEASEDNPTTCDGVFDDGDTPEVELAAECRDPASCAGRDMAVAGTTVATSDDNGVANEAADYTAVELEFDGNSSAGIPVEYADAGAMRLYARYEIPFDDEDETLSGEFMRGASNDFTWRPFGFRVTADGNPAAEGPGGDVYRSAARDFDVELAAVAWSADDDGEDNGVPDGYGDGDLTNNADLTDNAVLPGFGSESSGEDVALDAVLWRPGGGSDPGLTGGTTVEATAFADGDDVGPGQASTSVAYPEVGIIELRATLDDGEYLATGDDVDGRSGAVGRFVPAYFEQTVADRGEFEHVCGGDFTYFGQQFGYSTEPALTIKARNAQDDATKNYTGDFAKLKAEDINSARAGPSKDGSTDDVGGDPLEVWSDLAEVAEGTLIDNDDGTLTYDFPSDDSFRYAPPDGNRNDEQAIPPFDTDLTIALSEFSDSDDVTTDTTEDVTPHSTQIRFGRLSIDSKTGSEQQDLELPVFAEYINDDGTWVTNTDDNCTTLDLANEVTLEGESGNELDGDQDVEINSDGDTTNIDETSEIKLDAGESGLTFTAPGGTGEVTARFSLSDRYPFLLRKGSDGAFDQSAVGTATFGLFSGNRNQIYREEVLR